nr:PREDICTED: sialidase-3 [Latimeria chalumnae]|eukprot:XP_014353863.1 PREDICTED: sialidase-3 [Latimeria chalumnae]
MAYHFRAISRRSTTKENHIDSLTENPKSLIPKLAARREEFQDCSWGFSFLSEVTWSFRAQRLRQWEPERPLLTAILPGYRTMNPCPVYEQGKGILFLFFICVRGKTSECWQIFTGRNVARLCCVSSQDGGETWSELTDLTEGVIGEQVRRWATFAVGPGHGIQLQSGRLIIPAYAYFVRCRLCCLPLPWLTKPHAFTFYSDDRGESWHVGKIIRKLKTVECEVAEIEGQGSERILYCNARTSQGHRAEAISKDAGLDFEKANLCQQLVEPPHGCQGSVVSFAAPKRSLQLEGGSTRDGKEALLLPDWTNCSSVDGSVNRVWLVYSHPTSRKERVDLGTFLNQSPGGASGWSRPWVIHRGPSGYSDLACCESEHLFGCLFECGVHSECEEIAFCWFTMADLLKNVNCTEENPTGYSGGDTE